MPSERSRQALLDMLSNAHPAQSFIAGLDANSFAEDRRAVYAITRCLEIISEAARSLEPAIRDRYPQLPWRSIMAAGNIYRHEYDNIAEEQLWFTVSVSLLQRAPGIEAELARLSEEQP